MNNGITQEWYSYLGKLPDLLLALLVLLIGWIIAKAIEKAVYGILKRVKIDDKLYFGSRVGERKWTSEKVISKIVYFILLVFVFIAFFNMLDLTFIASPLVGMLSTMAAAIPNVLKAALILLFAWIVASLLKVLIEKLGMRAPIKNMLMKSNVAKDENDVHRYVYTAARIVFYLVLLIFLPGVLAALNITGVSGPFTEMLQSFLVFIPKLFAAAIILLVGWFVAKIVRDIVTNFLSAIGTERVAERFGISKLFQGTTVSSVIGTIVFVLIMIPVTISALDQLDIRGISEPAINMLNQVLIMLPNIAIAILLILVGIWVGKWVGAMVSRLLNRVGFNSLLRNMGIGRLTTTEHPYDPTRKTYMNLSGLVGKIVQIIIVFLFTVEALEIVHLDFLVVLATGILAYLPHVLAAIIIIGAGLYLGNLVKTIMSNVLSDHFQVLGTITKYAIIALSFFMALDQLKVADSIVNIAFMLILGGLALAFGLAFGLGGKEFAQKYLSKLDRKIEEEKRKPNNGGNDFTPPHNQ
ncbi:mechanosensitive ion channel [Rossellomorea aquimaris]|uniref:mechanosensitive ion channel n=1 Tax=Rossellomorea aquimaris TaxID=189382 RepID=UPI0007D0A347|nr:mechanosensitive ion channel [Rossellomorea aquimaris]